MAISSKLWLVSMAYTVPAITALGNTTYWKNPSAAVIGNKIIVQGGERYTNESSDSGTSSTMMEAKYGDLYSIDLNCSIQLQGDNAKPLDALLQEVKQTRAVTEPPVWWGNGLFWNTFEFYTFGGLPTKRQGSMDSSIVQGTLYPPTSGATFDVNGTNVGPWNPAENSAAGRSLNNVSSNVANGAWTSAPSENLAWWIGGMEALNKGPINGIPASSLSDYANTTSRRFIQADLRNPAAALLTELELPPSVQTSAEGALVWLPFSKKGILLAFGGVSGPADMGLTSEDSESNELMTSINVYDIASQTWHVQPTLESSNSPKQLAQFCTAVATSEDGDGFFIYVYGGYDGTYTTSDPIGESRDDIWVLSIPAFQWTKMHDGVTEGTTEHRRQNHICVAPNPSQMISIGGMQEYQGSISKIIEVFDFNKNAWVDTYNASSTESYVVPSKVITQLGNGDGGFSVIPSGLNPSVSSLLSSSRDATSVAYVPRTCGVQTRNSDNSTAPAWKKPVMIAVPVVVVLALVAGIAVFYFRRRRTVVNEAESRTETRQHKVMSWLGKPSGHDPPPAASDSTGTEDTMVGTGPSDYFGRPVPKTVNLDIHEVDGRSNMASPLSFNESGHGTPYNIVSPALSGSHEVDAASRHELDGQISSESNMSPRNHPLYPASLGGTNIGSTDAGSVSHPSESLRPHPYLGHISPYELPQDRSNENLSQPPNDLSLDDGPNTHHVQSNKQYVYTHGSNRATSPIARKPLSSGGRTHHRQISSMSSNAYQLPSPDPEENQRRSTFIDSLPDAGGHFSSAYPQRQTTRQSSGPVRSAYQENFDDMSR